MSMQLDASQTPSMAGGWRFSAPDGDERELSYTADKNGFVPVADYLPKPVQPLVENNLAQVKANQDFRWACSSSTVIN